MLIEKSCLFCRYFNFDMGSPGYSEYMPGSDAEFSCMMGYWKNIHNQGNDSVELFVKSIETAKTCGKFERKK
jgi:hypothetical protein